MMIVAILALTLPYACLGFGLVGGTSDVTLAANDANVMFAKDKTMEYFATQDKVGAARTLTIKSATSQVVAGILYTITLESNMNEMCTVKVWERSWMNPQRQISDGPNCVAAMSKRAGGVSATTLAEDNVNVVFAKQATMDHFTATGAADTTRTMSIKSATQQVVSGMLYTITFSTNMNEECTVKVWEQAWMTPQRQITDGPSCVAVQNRRQIAGGVSAATLTMDNVNVMLAKQATMEHFAATDAGNTRTLSIKSATQQVVAGMLYTITFSTNMNEECTVKVWEQAWMTPQRGISSGPNCVAVQNRRQLGPGGGIAGGVSAADMNSAEVQAALNFGVKAVNGMENSMYVRKVQGSYTVTKQVVSGMLYKFTDVVLAQTDCFKGSNTDLSMCNVSDPADENTCTFTIAVQAWATPSMTVVNWSC